MATGVSMFLLGILQKIKFKAWRMIHLKALQLMDRCKFLFKICKISAFSVQLIDNFSGFERNIYNITFLFACRKLRDNKLVLFPAKALERQNPNIL